MLQVLHMAEPLELSTVLQLLRILIARTLCLYSVLSLSILYNAYHIARGRSRVFLYQSTGS